MSARTPARERLYRARRIGTTFARSYVGIRTERFIERRLSPADMPRRWERRHLRNARAIHEAALELHGLILKGCQFIGTRSDVVPEAYVDVLASLQDRVPPRDFETARSVVERELDRPLHEAFADFDPTPVASASLAQVHRARRHDGREVAVKVQYPEIEALVTGDLANLRALFRAVDWLEEDFELLPLIEELGQVVPEELNFANEGRNAEAIGKFFAERTDVRVPSVHWDLTSERVLVSDFVDGIKISDVEGLRSAGLDTDRIVTLLVETYCEQIFRRGFFHADPHPGNLLIQPMEGGAPGLVYLDFGLARRLPEGFRKGALDFVAAMLQSDRDAMSRALLALGFRVRDGSYQGLEDIAEAVLQVAGHVQARGHMDRDMRARLRKELPGRIRANPLVEVPSHLVLVARVVTMLSGLAHTLGSRIDLATTILPYVALSQDE